ncbi:MAG: phosphoenolpyruvate carboxykinase (GTP) [Nanoarchaeota archaeon]|nr:phosphoenolpyruvate carboxykinase (GTP) [Nanoarchaeota archaeon]
MMDSKSREKLKALNNPQVIKIVEKYVKLCKPAKVTVLTDSDEDIGYLRQGALREGEEAELAMEGHTIHFDGYDDQARDKEHTCVMLPKGKGMSKAISAVDKETGLKEVLGLMDGIMRGKEMLVCFFSLGPRDSEFTIPALQITDSLYVAHSETILYRPGYDEFKRCGDKFFHFIHSAGELTERQTSKNIDKRRVYMDLEDERVFTINNQYAGNSVGLKKLALRLGISKAHREDWLCEHMLVMGAKRKGRTTYFTGAFPSGCGKTSTAMIPGQSIVGDDIAYLRAGKDGRCYAANVEQGIFGIIQDVNPVDDPLINQTLTSPREVIFSNVLIKEGRPYWLGMKKELPDSGMNHWGSWKKGQKDDSGKEILPCHKNARYTIRLQELDNIDPDWDSGVPISGIIYGGRDSETNPPVIETFSWPHGVFNGAALESETTAQTIGKEGQLKHDPMANIDFLVIPLGVYINNHLKFGERLDKEPKIFATNYFLKENGKFMNEKVDKKVWLMWMEGRVHDEFEAIETPIGLIPKYEDIKQLFKEIFKREYTKEDYEKQFSIRVEKLLARLDRIEAIYKAEKDVPELFHEHIEQQRQRLSAAQKEHGKSVISPFLFQIEKT